MLARTVVKVRGAWLLQISVIVAVYTEDAALPRNCNELHSMEYAATSGKVNSTTLELTRLSSRVQPSLPRSSLHLKVGADSTAKRNGDSW